MEVEIIRKALESDRMAIALINARAFSNDWSLLDNDSNKVAQALFNGINIDVYYVACIDDKVVGFLSYVTENQRALAIDPKSFQKVKGFFKGYAIAMMLKNEFEEPLHLKKSQVYIDILGIDPDYAHRGIGTKLIQYLIDNSNFAEFSLKVTNINMNAIQCYRKNGFEEYKREKVKYPKQMGFEEYIYMARAK
ncbi:MAG: N-acetyltransferase [Longicatena sp.]